jgi:lysyl-tRNA synthetase class 2
MHRSGAPRTLGAVIDPVPRRVLAPLAAAMAVGVGIVNILSALTPDSGWRADLVQTAVGHEVPTAAHALALQAGVGLVLVGVYLAKRHRRAWAVAVAILVLAGVFNLLKGLDVEEAAVSWALAGVLVYARDGFYVRGDPDGWTRAAFLVLGAAVCTAVSIAASELLGHSMGHRTLAEIALLVAAAWLVFRPLAAPRRLPGRTARELARGIVEHHGGDTLSFFKLRADQHYFFGADRRAFLAYRVEARVLVVAGDPVGPPAALPGLLRELLEFAAVRELRVSVVGASERFAEVAEKAGLRGWYIGDEAILDTREFSLEGRRIRKVRQAVARVERAGYQAVVTPLGELSEGELSELECLAERARCGAPERGFSMALDSLRGDHLADSVVVLARDSDGRAGGFLHFTPCFGRDAMSLGFMRRDPETPNGLMEFLIVRSVEALRERGVTEVSLNFAPFARLLHSPETRFERLLGVVARLGGRAFGIESLYRFNAKFFPRWQPRYLLYQGAFGLPRAGLATMWAERQLPRPPRRPAQPSAA